MKDRQGFTVGSVVVIIVLAIVIIIAARFVGRANESNQNSSDALNSAFGSEGEVNDPSDDNYIPDAPERSGQERPIRSVEAQVQALQVILVAKLSSAFTGSCHAYISLPDGSNDVRFNSELENTSDCEIYIPREKLEAGKTWKYRMTYETSDGNYFGDYSTQTFELQ